MYIYSILAKFEWVNIQCDSLLSKTMRNEWVCVESPCWLCQIIPCHRGSQAEHESTWAHMKQH